MKIPAILTTVVLAASPLLAQEKSVDLPGTWNSFASTDDGENEYTLTIKKNESGLSGVSVARDSGEERELDRIKVKDGTVTIEVDIENNGQTGIIRVEAKQTSPGKLEGKWQIVDTAGEEYLSGDWKAKKKVKAKLEGTWKSAATMEDGSDLESNMTIKKSADKYSGNMKSDRGEIALKTIKVDGSKVAMTFDIEVEGESLDGTIDASFSGENSLDGSWAVKNDSDVEVASGPWNATREGFDPVGAWEISAVIPDGTYSAVANIKKNDEGKLVGTIEGPDGKSRDLDNIKAEGNAISFTTDYESDEATGVITVKTKAGPDGKLIGTWALTGSDGGEIASDSISATRKRSNPCLVR